jgi:hypothetical protein
LPPGAGKAPSGASQGRSDPGSIRNDSTQTLFRHTPQLRRRVRVGVRAMRLIPLTLLCLVLLPATAAAQDPTVDTGPAEAVGPTSATLTGTIDPEGTARSYHFEVGTTTGYGLQTPVQTTGTGTTPETVKAAVQGLAASTTYHYRLVAGGVQGQDRTFTTASVPATPGISRLRATEKTATSARLTALIDPNGSATTWYVEWGTTASFGNRTPDQSLPAGTAGVPVSVLLDRLPSYQRIHWRVVATNATGVRRSGRTSFTTARAPSGVTLSALPATTTWSRSVALAGRVHGAGVNGLTVALEQSSFPFNAGFHQVASARTTRVGDFRFPPQAVFLATHFRVVPLIAPQLVSPVAATRVRSRVTIGTTHRTRRALRIVGGVQPGLPAGLATLQRRTRSGGWRRVARRALALVSDVRSEYGFKVRRKRRAARYRVVVAARDGGAHARGYSRSLRVGKKRRR